MQVLLALWLFLSGTALVFDPSWLSHRWLAAGLWLGMLLAWLPLAFLSVRYGRWRAPQAPLMSPPGLWDPQAGLDLAVLDPTVLAELEAISLDPQFLERLLAAFMADNRVLLEQLEAALRQQRYTETLEILHGLKGAALSVGAMAFKATCQRCEWLSLSADMRGDGQDIYLAVKMELDRLDDALNAYRKQRLERDNRGVV